MAHQNHRVFIATRDETHGLLHVGLERCPPRFVITAQFFNDFGMFGSDVGFLTGIGFDVVELLAVDQTPALGHGDGVVPFRRDEGALDVNEECAIRPHFVDGTMQRSAQRHAIKSGAFWFFQFKQFDQCG